MKKLYKLAILACVLGIFMLVLTGCTKTKSYTFKVETGDNVEIKMNVTGGYDLTSELPIKFSKDDEVLSQGIFAKEEYYDQYYDSIINDSRAKIIEEKSTDDIDYVFYQYDDDEFNYIIKIKKSNTCFILGNNVSRESAQDIFKKLEFKLK